MKPSKAARKIMAKRGYAECDHLPMPDGRTIGEWLDALAEVEAERDKLGRWLDLCVWVDPARQGGHPCVGGTRIPTAMVAKYVADGMYDELRSGWEELTDRQILLACWYEAMHTHRRPDWLTWAMTARDALWHHDGDLPPLPPTETL